MNAPTHTFQSQLDIDEKIEQALNACAELLSRVEHSLFADIMAGKNPSELKSNYILRFGITARQFNACRVQVEGKIESLKQLLREAV